MTQGPTQHSALSTQHSEPTVLFFNINGSGLGHMNRCLAYARQMQGRARVVFFSLASAIEIIEEMGFEADYMVSHFWSRSQSNAWNRELAVRLGLMFERVRPDVVVFDGTWPFQGLMAACEAYKVPRMVWSNRGLHKADMEPVPVDEGLFDLVLQPGEIGAEYVEEQARGRGRKVTVPPVTLLSETELEDRATARRSLGLSPEGRYALLQLGPGNLKDVGSIGEGLAAKLQAEGYTPVWARAPISVRDKPLPAGARTVSVYPLARYMRAFDVFLGAAGYNSCCEVIQSRVPSLLVPNTQLVDDQARRARMVADNAPAVVSACETEAEQAAAVAELLALVESPDTAAPGIAMDGARRAADEILGLVAPVVSP